jgi:AmiR/NasT family two-component response regulator
MVTQSPDPKLIRKIMSIKGLTEQEAYDWLQDMLLDRTQDAIEVSLNNEKKKNKKAIKAERKVV